MKEPVWARRLQDKPSTQDRHNQAKLHISWLVQAGQRHIEGQRQERGQQHDDQRLSNGIQRR